MKRLADAFGQAATQAPQPMQVAASNAWSAVRLPIGIRFASWALPVFTEMYPPDCTMRSRAPRSTTRSRSTGKAAARQGSMWISSPSRNCRMWSWQVVVRAWGPWGMPLMTIPHVPQMPSRQSWSNATGSSPFSTSSSLSWSSISRKELSGLTSPTL